MISEEIRVFLADRALNNFLRYVKIDTTSSEESGTHPSSKGQWDLAKLLVEELKELGINDAHVDEFCYVYATVPASDGVNAPAITFCSHMDTSPAESGKDVKPIIRKNYDGGEIKFPDAKDLVLSPKDSPELKMFIGEDIITASGKTLLGADDKAGIAEIMAAIAAFQKYPNLKHPELKICFTPDEEIGEGTYNINLKKLGKYGYTMDGGMIGEIEEECFDAFGVSFVFHGINVHPGYAKNRMVNAASIAARFISDIPESETPEHTEKMEGFYHLTGFKGDENEACFGFILRDFRKEKNLERIEYLKKLKALYEHKYPGLKIDMEVKDQYNNMIEVLKKYPEVIDKAEKAVEMAGLKVHKNAIRGGTDGARLSFMGMPTPNIFTGGMLFHSKKEWIPVSALEKGAEVVVLLASLWS